MLRVRSRAKYNIRFFYKNNFKTGYKNNEAQICPIIKNNVRTIQAGNSTVSSVEILQMLTSIEFPLRFIRLDDYNLGIFEIFQELFLTVVVRPMSTFKAEIS